MYIKTILIPDEKWISGSPASDWICDFLDQFPDPAYPLLAVDTSEGAGHIVTAKGEVYREHRVPGHRGFRLLT